MYFGVKGQGARRLQFSRLYGCGGYMHYIISDLHMNDTGMAQCVSDAELIIFANKLEVDCKIQKVTLLLLGDILDLLRSPDWEQLWREKHSAPWSGIGKGFSGFSRSYSE